MTMVVVGILFGIVIKVGYFLVDWKRSYGRKESNMRYALTLALLDLLFGVVVGGISSGLAA